MATTVTNIIDRAGERSNLNDTTLIATDELIAYVSSLEQLVYLTAARINPNFFGKEGNTASRADNDATWAYATTPGNVAAISLIEVQAITGTVSGVSVGDTVNVIDRRFPEHGLSPRVYIRDKTIYQYGSELGSDGSNFVDTLKLYYSHLPTRRTAVGNTLDLPDEYDSLIILPLARIMAVRDQRPEEVNVLDSEFLIHWQTFVQQVSVEDEVTIRELAQVPAAFHQVGAPTNAG